MPAHVPKKAHHRTKAIHGKPQTQSWQFDKHLIPPLTSSTTFRLESLQRGAQGFCNFASGSTTQDPILIYDRLDEPSTLMLEEQLADMESAQHAISFGSGMAAISSAILSTCIAGDTLIAHRTLYGCSYSLITNWLPRMGLQTEITNLNDHDLKDRLSNPKVRAIYFESVSNPSLELIDIPYVVELVTEENKKRNDNEKIRILVDNTFATPWGFRPLDWGADFSIQSLTKNICGFGTEMGGAVLTNHSSSAQSLRLIRKDFGGIIHPSAAWHILVYGISTQALRFEKQQENAQKIAEFLSCHPMVEQVLYPGLKSFPQFALAQKLLVSPEGKFAPGFMINFRLKGGAQTCQAFVDDIAKNAYSITLAVSLGLTKTLIEVPGFMTHSAIPEQKQKETNLDPRDIRLSLGLESIDDLLKDLSEALHRLQTKSSDHNFSPSQGTLSAAEL